MHLKDIIRSPKESVDWGKWQSGPVPRREFPLSKHKKSVYSLGPSYRWRMCKFSIGNNNFRVWIMFRADLEKYAAWLGQEQDSDMIVLARYEFHGTHPGWHTHAACEREDQITPGRSNTPLHLRIPKARTKHRRLEFQVTEENGVDIAGKAFKLHRSENGMFK